MKKWFHKLGELLNHNKDDLEWLLFVGLPFGILIILIHSCFDSTYLF
jgi:hypothetical protein